MNINVTMKSSKLQHTAFFESFPKTLSFEIRSLDEFTLLKQVSGSILTILTFKSSRRKQRMSGIYKSLKLTLFL